MKNASHMSDLTHSEYIVSLWYIAYICSFKYCVVLKWSPRPQERYRMERQCGR